MSNATSVCFAEDIVGPINYYRAAMRYKQPTISKLDTPMLMIWGTEDGALVRSMAETSGDYFKNYTLRFIEGASHWVQSEEPEKVTQHIREFISDKKME